MEHAIRWSSRVLATAAVAALGACASDGSGAPGTDATDPDHQDVLPADAAHETTEQPDIADGSVGDAPDATTEVPDGTADDDVPDGTAGDVGATPDGVDACILRRQGGESCCGIDLAGRENPGRFSGCYCDVSAWQMDGHASNLPCCIGGDVVECSGGGRATWGFSAPHDDGFACSSVPNCSFDFLAGYTLDARDVDGAGSGE